MSVLIPVKITVALMPTALILSEVMTAHVILDIQEMDTHVMVNLVYMQMLMLYSRFICYIRTKMCGWCCAIITQYTISKSQMLTNVLVIHIHVTVKPTALTTLVVSHVTATQGILEVVLSVKVRTYLILCMDYTSM